MIDDRYPGWQYCISVDQGVPFDGLAVCDESVASLDGLFNFLEDFQDAVRAYGGEANREIGKDYVRHTY
ncbi:hypothetical protein D9M68_615980 [compost metagenome]